MSPRLPLMRRLVIAVLTAVAAACGAAPAHAARIEYAVSLGDALATGYQQGLDGVGVSSPADYTARVFAHRRDRDPELKLRRFGCVGEDTRAFRAGSCPGARNEQNRLAQLKRATKFLRRHRGRIAYVTLALGSTVLERCWSPSGMDGRCLSAGQATF